MLALYLPYVLYGLDFSSVLGLNNIVSILFVSIYIQDTIPSSGAALINDGVNVSGYGWI